MSFSYPPAARVYPGSEEDGGEAGAAASPYPTPTPLPTPGERAVLGVHIFTNAFYDKGPFMNYAQKKVGIPALVLQMFCTVCAVSLAIIVVSVQVTDLFNQPVTQPGSILKPSGAEMWSLFKENAAYQSNPASGGITELKCECTNTNTPLGAVLNYSLREDFFCTWALAATFRNSDKNLNAFSTFSDTQCFADQATAKTKIDAFLATLGVDERARSSINLELYRFDEETRRDVPLEGNSIGILKALCFFSFGTMLQTPLQARGFTYNTAYTNMMDACYYNSSDFIFATAKSSAYALNRDRRAYAFLENAATTCASLRSIRTVFESTVKATSRDSKSGVSPIFISATTALDPEVLEITAKNLFYSSLQQFGSEMSAFAPGFSPDLSSPLLDKNLYSMYGAWFFGMLDEPTPDTYLFSSRLPFARTDFAPSPWFINGSGSPYTPIPGIYGEGSDPAAAYSFVVNRFFANTLEMFHSPTFKASTPGPLQPTLTGATRLTFVPKASTMDQYPVFSYFSGRSSSFPGGKDSYVVVGSDFITLLDACANKEALKMDVFSIHPTAPLPGVNSSWFLPQDLTNMCAVGTAPPSTPLFTFDVTCPPFLVDMGNARRKSFYFNHSSPFRITGNDIVASLGQSTWTSLLATLNSGNPLTKATLDTLQLLTTIPSTGDQLNIQNVLSSLFIDMNSLSLSASDPIAHYTTCAPLSCTFTTVTPKSTIYKMYEVVDKVGAGMSALLLVFGTFMLLFCYIVFLLYPPKGADILDPDTLGGPGMGGSSDHRMGGGGGGGGGGGDVKETGASSSSRAEGLLQLEQSFTQELNTLRAELAALKAAGVGEGAEAAAGEKDEEEEEGGEGAQKTLRGEALVQQSVERLEKEEALQRQVQEQQQQLQQQEQQQKEVQQKLELLQAQLERILQQQGQGLQGMDSGKEDVQGGLQPPPPSPRKPKSSLPPREEGDSTSSLPPGWEAVDRGPGQRVYYLHTASKKTQWERPMVAGGGGGGTPTPTRPPAPGAPPGAMPSSPQGLGMVKGAPGWTTVRNVDGRIYYFHEASKRTQWEHPAGAGGDALDSFAGSPTARGGGGGGGSGNGGMYLRSPS